MAWVTLRKPDGSCGAEWHAAQKLVTSLPAAQPLRKEKRGIAEALPEFRIYGHKNVVSATPRTGNQSRYLTHESLGMEVP